MQLLVEPMSECTSVLERCVEWSAATLEAVSLQPSEEVTDAHSHTHVHSQSSARYCVRTQHAHSRYTVHTCMETNDGTNCATTHSTNQAMQRGAHAQNRRNIYKNKIGDICVAAYALLVYLSSASNF
jgi:hypothetical protein